MESKQVDVCIVGAGPAGMFLGLLLSSRGVKVTVLERNEDFAREFRGEILQPRFIQLARQAGLFEFLMSYPHEKVTRAEISYMGKLAAWFDVAKVAPDAPHILWMTQPVMLKALAEYGSNSSNFSLQFGTKVKELLQEAGTTTGVKGEQNGQPFEIKAKLVVGADGRFSSIRKLGGFEFAYERHSIDVLWFQIDRPEGHNRAFQFYLSDSNPYVILPKYPKQLQCGMVLRANGFSTLRKKGIEALQKELKRAHPSFTEFADSLVDFEPFTLLKGHLSYVKEWAKEGCILIGDAAHTCSPVGGIGVSMAVGTAIVAADVILEGLQNNRLTTVSLAKIQAIRHREMKRVHFLQHNVARYLQLPTFLRRLFPIGGRILSHLGIVPLIARRLLSERKALPLQNDFSSETKKLIQSSHVRK